MSEEETWHSLNLNSLNLMIFNPIFLPKNIYSLQLKRGKKPPLCIHTTSFICHLLVGIQTDSASTTVNSTVINNKHGSLWILVTYRFLQGPPEWDSKIHTVVPFSVFWGTSILIFIITVPDYNSISIKGFSFPHTHQHLLSFVLFTIAILTQVRQNLNAGLICISLMINKECWLTFQIYIGHFSFFFQKLFNSSGHLLNS